MHSPVSVHYNNTEHLKNMVFDIFDFNRKRYFVI